MNNKTSIRNNNFDLLRLFAAISVMFIHGLQHLYYDFGNEPNQYIEMLRVLVAYIPGVSVFFLISGYLILMSYEKNSNLMEYIKNRILRIYPALIVNIILSVFILSIFNFITFNFDFFKWLVAQLSIFQFYNAEMFRGFGVGVINGALWTVSVELTFYILLPILFFFYKKNNYIIWGIFFASFMLWIYNLSSDKEILLNKLIQSTIMPYLFLFIIGMSFYKYHNKVLQYIENKFIFWLFLFIVFHSIIHFYKVEMGMFLHIIQWIIFSFMIFSFAFSFRGISKKLLKGNDYTYGIYIYHMLVINIFVHFQLVGSIGYLSILMFLSGLLGIASWYLIEKPFLKLKKHSLFMEQKNN